MKTETAMILTGEGYALTITPEAEQNKRDLLVASAEICTVTTNDESADAAYHMRGLAQMRILVDKSRKAIKEPVIRIGKLIDETARNFMLEIDDEESRIRKLIGDHATEVARLAKIKLEEERLAFDAARLARDAANAAQDAAETTGRLSDIVAAKQADQARQDALAARLEASSELVAAKVADGVRFVWDFEVTSMDTLSASAPDLVKVEPRRREVLNWLNSLEEIETPEMVSYVAAKLGIRAYKIPSISTR
jgi:hypothetical protein